MVVNLFGGHSKKWDYKGLFEFDLKMKKGESKMIILG